MKRLGQIGLVAAMVSGGACEVDVDAIEPRVEEAPTVARPLGCRAFDLDDDGAVGFADFLEVSANYDETVDGVTYDFGFFLGLSSWYDSDCPSPAPDDDAGCFIAGDLDGDGDVTAHDLAILERVEANGSPHADVLGVSDFNGTEIVGDGDSSALAKELASETGAGRLCTAQRLEDGGYGGVINIDWGRIADANYDRRGVYGWLSWERGARFVGKTGLEGQCRQPDANTALGYETPSTIPLSQEVTVEAIVPSGLYVDEVESCPGESAVSEDGRKGSCTAPLCDLLSDPPNFVVLSTGYNYDEHWRLPDDYVRPDCTDGVTEPAEHCCIGLWDYVDDEVNCDQLGYLACNGEPSCYWGALGGCYNLTEDGVRRLLPWNCDRIHIENIYGFQCGGLPSWIDECGTITTHYFGHGLGASSFTGLAAQVCKAADSCTSASFRDWGCETFESVEWARAKAEKLAQELQEAGRGDMRVEVTANRKLSRGARECPNINHLMLRASQTPITFWVVNGECDVCE